MSRNGSVVTFDDFNPNQKIQLNSKVNRFNVQAHQSRRIDHNEIDFSQKINLKNTKVKTEQRPPPLLIRELNSEEKINLKVKVEPKGLLPSFLPPSQPLQPSLALSDHNEPINLKVKKQIESVSNQIPNSIVEKPQTVNSFMDPSQTINLQKFQKKLKSNSQSITMQTYVKMVNGQSKPQIKKNRLRDQNTDFTSLRYQCFCSKQYLSYCAAYHHLKKDHESFLRENRRFSFTNIVETVDPVHGFKIKKIMEQRLKRNPEDIPAAGPHLSRRAKRRIKLKSQQIRNLTHQLQELQKQRENQIRSMRIYERKIMKSNELVTEYQKMIYSYETILGILNIRPIMEGLKTGMDYGRQQEVVDQLDDNDEQYFPQK